VCTCTAKELSQRRLFQFWGICSLSELCIRQLIVATAPFTSSSHCFTVRNQLSFVECFYSICSDNHHSGLQSGSLQRPLHCSPCLRGNTLFPAGTRSIRAKVLLSRERRSATLLADLIYRMEFDPANGFRPGGQHETAVRQACRALMVAGRTRGCRLLQPMLLSMG
jgi:hypothetical protein